MKLPLAVLILLAVSPLAAPIFAQTQPATAPGGLFIDLHRNWNAGSPEPNIFFGATNLQCRENAVPDFITLPHGGQGYPPRFCHTLNFTSTSPGFSLGNSFPGSAGGWQIYKGFDLSMKVYGAGIKGPFSNAIACFGIGDCNNDIEMESIGGRTAPSDEGTETERMTLIEAPYTYSGTIVSEGRIGARTIQTSCPPVTQVTTTRCDAQGVGRYLIEEAGVYSGAAVSVEYGSHYQPTRLTVTPALPKEMLSTAWGVLTSPCLIDQTAANTGTSCSFSVKVASGRFKTNYLVSSTGLFHNQSQLTSAEGSGDAQTLTMVAHHSIPAGAYLYQGREYGDITPSCTGTAMELLANTVAKLKYPVDVIGCSAGSAAATGEDSSTLDVAMFLAGDTYGLDLANVVLGSMRVTRNLTSDALGNVTLVTDGDPVRYIGQTITIKNSTYFSGQCTGVAYSKAGQSITCKEPSAGTHTDPAFDRVSVSLGTTGYGNSSLVLHRMAEVLDVRNPETLAVDGSFTLEANEMKNVKGTEVEEAHYYSQQFALHANGMGVYTPYHSQFHTAIGINLFTGAYGPGFTGLSIGNSTPLTGYAGFGGTRFGPDLIHGGGLWKTALNLDFAPAPSGSALEKIGCPISPGGCADTAYEWMPRAFAGNSGGFGERWIPAGNHYVLQVSSSKGTSEFHVPPEGFAMNRPLGMSGRRIEDVAAGTTGSDVATVGQLPLSASFVSGSGDSDVLNIAGVTSASHCSLTATNSSAAANIAGTYISSKSTGHIAISHGAVKGMTYDVLCTSY